MTTARPGVRLSIRTKVTAALLLVSLVPMAAVGVVAYRSARTAAQDQAIERLEGIAAVQEERVNAYALSSLENMALVASRTQLRRSFAAELDEPSAENVELMQRILGDAVGSSATARRIELVDLDGQVVASSDGEQLGASRADEPAFVLGTEGPDLSHTIERDGVRLGIHGRPVALDDRQLGVVLIEASLDPLLRLTTDYTGLGQSGETVLASGFDQESVEVLGQVRFPDDLDDGSVVDGDLLRRALAGTEGDVSDQLDYRGMEVFAVARGVDAIPGWALAVKVDRSEALADAQQLRNVLLVAFGIATLVVLAASSLLASALSRPVIELHDAAVAVAAGQTERRARVRSKDELAELAVQFNRMTDELTHANARLRMANEQLEEFVYISSHDLKSPLRSISSFGQLLQAEYDSVFDEQGREYLGFIREGTARMHGVIEDLLDYLRIEKEDQVAEDVDLNQVFDDIIELHRPLLDECEAEVRRGVLPTVNGSRALVRQLFDNIIQNSVRYRRPDQPLIIEVVAERDNGIWRIEVSDNGVGVPDDRRQDAFTVFKRLSETGDGSGMGLAICRRIARRHGGEVRMADSDLGGVSLVVTLADGRSLTPANGGDTKVHDVATEPITSSKVQEGAGG